MIDENLIIDLYKKGSTCYEIEELLKIKWYVIYHILKKNNIPRSNRYRCTSKYKINENYFEKIDSNDKAYFLGFLYADGSNYDNHITFKLSKIDKYILEKFNEYLQHNRPLREEMNIICKDKNGIIHHCKNCFVLYIGNKKIASDLNKLGVVPNKTLKIRFPFFLDKQYYSHFIRGFFDGDGSVGYNPTKRNPGCSHVNFTSKNINFGNDLMMILKKVFDIKSSIVKDRNCFKLIITSAENKIKFFDIIYKNSEGIRLDRKYLKFLQVKQNYENFFLKRFLVGIYKAGNKFWVQKSKQSKRLWLGSFDNETDAAQIIINFEKNREKVNNFQYVDPSLFSVDAFLNKRKELQSQIKV